METTHGPTVPRRRLRSELRAARDAAGMTQEQVAERLEWSSSKVIRIEAGTVGISTTDLRALLTLYGVRDPSRVTELADLAKLSRKRTWWTAIKDEQISPNQRMLIGFESEATHVHYYHPLLVPGLLQTEAYAAAIIRECAVPTPTEESIATRLRVRLTRQRETLERASPPRLHVVIDESALHRPVGDADVAAEQLTHLLELDSRPEISIQVVPLHAGAHPGIVYGGFAILQFEDDNDVVYLEGGNADLILSDQAARIATYWTVMRRARELALSEKDSARLIATIRDSLAR